MGLESLYELCKEQFESCMSSPLPEDEYLQLIESFRKLLKKVKKANLWSKNETIEEVQTSALPYFLIPHQFVHLLLQCPYGHRPSMLEELLVWLSLFLERCLAMEAMNSNDRRQYDREEDDPWEPGELRTLKVERYRRHKELNEKLEFLKKKKEELH